MKRRSFIKETTTVITGLGLSTVSCTKEKIKIPEQTFEVYVTMDQERVSFHSKVIKEKIKIVHIADTHLHMDDHRGKPF